jgi:LmbE family N-acetylglucosaminyl deacetylase
LGFKIASDKALKLSTTSMISERGSKSLVHAEEVFQGVIVVAVPHMDDEVLACGGTLAQLRQKDRVHLIYATDGSRSPAPVLTGLDSAAPDLGEMRVQESRRALKLLGIPQENLHFLGFPEARLRNCRREYSEALINLVRKIKPDHILAPFRYDRHSDHLVVNRATTAALRSGVVRAQLSEYFVYHRWRLLTGGDVRKYIHSKHLIRIDIKNESAIKRQALACFKSQTTKLYTWQDRPILSEKLLDEECQTPEVFLRYDPAFPGTNIFANGHAWIRCVHLIETPLKKKKETCRALLYRFTHLGKK